MIRAKIALSDSLVGLQAKAGLVIGQSLPIMSQAQSNTANPSGQRMRTK